MLEHNIDDYTCCRSTIIKSLERKFGKSINISNIENAEVVPGDGIKKFTFNIGGKDADGNGNELRIRTTEEGLMFKLLELAIQRKHICKFCESNLKDSCIQIRLETGNVKKEELVHKVDEELCFTQ